MFHSKQNPYLLNLFSPWIFCRFLIFPKNVESPFTILCNCLHERCFKLHTSFRLETGSPRKISLSFRFVASSRKKSFLISMKSHSVEAKLCNLYQFLKRFMVLQVSHYFAHLSCSIILQSTAFGWCSFCTNLNKFCMGQTVYFSCINRNVSIKQILYSHISSFSQLVTANGGI